LSGIISETATPSSSDPNAQLLDNDPMLQDILPDEEDNFSQVDLQLNINFLEEVTLLPICVNWTSDFQFMVRQFRR
jgi:hypothetical protein